jgi:hypothetical protein
MGIKLNLKGEQTPHIIILEAKCQKCGTIWKKKVD